MNPESQIDGMDRDRPAFRVVVCRFERTSKKYEFCALLIDLCRSGRRRGAKSSEKIEKSAFLARPGRYT